MLAVLLLVAAMSTAQAQESPGARWIIRPYPSGFIGDHGAFISQTRISCDDVNLRGSQATPTRGEVSHV